MLKERLRNQLLEIGKRNNKIEKIILFGSRAIGDYKERSDIDLAFLAPDMTSEEWSAFALELEDNMDTLLLLDLVRLEEAPEELRTAIAESGVILYEVEEKE